MAKALKKTSKKNTRNPLPAVTSYPPGAAEAAAHHAAPFVPANTPGPGLPPSAAHFHTLPRQAQRTVRRNIIRVLRAGGFLGRGKYDPVTRDVPLRERLAAETGGEEEALTIDERNRLIALVRNLDRNSDHLNGFLEQLELNVVGVSGGKATFDFPPQFAESAAALRSAFGEWARECEFFDGVPLQELLKRALRTKFITGRAVLLFDDGAVCDSGKVIVFEGDAVADIPAKEFKARFPAGWSQHQGLLKDEVGRTRGAFCSMSQRGERVFRRLTDDQGRLAVWALVKDASARWIDSPFALYQNLKRINQIVSVPGVAPSVGAIMDLGELTKIELQSAKKSAQTFASVSRREEQKAAQYSDGLNPNEVPLPAPDASDEEIAAAAAQVADDGEGEDLEFVATEGAATIYEIMPDGYKMDMLSPVHPNANVMGMVTWLKQNVSWANGIAGLYATGKADSSYSASLVEQAITWPKFEAEQQTLKTSVLDWLLCRWMAWARRTGTLPAGLELPEGWLRRVNYSFPRKREPDAQKEQGAIAQGFRNQTTSLRKIHGPDWRERADELAEEIAYCRERGIVHPSLSTVSGQVADLPGGKDNPGADPGNGDGDGE